MEKNSRSHWKIDYAYTTQDSLGLHKIRNRKHFLLTPHPWNHAAAMNPETKCEYNTNMVDINCK